jgi:hypothetical protein
MNPIGDERSALVLLLPKAASGPRLRGVVEIHEDANEGFYVDAVLVLHDFGGAARSYPDVRQGTEDVGWVQRGSIDSCRKQSVNGL